MNDVYIIESWFGERLNVRNVYAADADDALQTHELHYPGEYIVSMQRGDGLSVRWGCWPSSSASCCWSVSSARTSGESSPRWPLWRWCTSLAGGGWPVSA
jgi:hypothetical protein